MGGKIEVGVLGATGTVGQEVIALLANHPWFTVTWIGASERSAGKRYRNATSWRLPVPRPDHVADMIVDTVTPGQAPRLVFSGLDASVAGTWRLRSPRGGTSWSATPGTTGWTRSCRWSSRRSTRTICNC